MIRLASVVGILVLSIVAPLGAQNSGSTEEVRKVLDDGLAAYKRGDKAAYGRYLADELRWIVPDGTIRTKQEWLAGMGGTGPTWTDVEIQVIGSVALVTAVATSSDGKNRSRAARTLVKRDGRWQLVLHAQTPMK
jgi:ketosteroid isomerase-like protein